MTRAEVVKLLKFLNSYYQSKFQYPKDSKAENKLLQDTWFMFLKEYDHRLTSAIVKKLVINSEWPPTPGEIIKEAEHLKDLKENKLTPGKAWELVLDVIGKYGTGDFIGQARDALPSKVLVAVGHVGGLNAIGKSDVANTYLMDKFMKIYENIQVEEKSNRYLPGSVREEVEKLTDHYSNNKPALLEGKLREED